MIIGSDRVLKFIKNNKVAKVVLASNAPDLLKERIKHYQKIVNFELHELEINNSELGVLCKKPFPIASLAITN